MAMKQFGPVTLEGIAAGALAQKLDEQLVEAARRLAAYVNDGGQDMTKRAKSEVTLKVVLQHVEQGLFTVKGDVTCKAPSVPLPATDRLVLTEENGEPVLLMATAPEINPGDDPRQMTLSQQQTDRQERKKEL